jgi:hypothetical protein
MIERNVNIGEYLVDYVHQSAIFYAYLLVGFIVPFTLGHPQLLVGTVVNAVLVLTALEMDSFKQIVPLLFAPSLAVLARGLIFGPFTPFLVIMLPMIWIGNAILVLGIREIHKKRDKNYSIALGASALAKTGFLFSSAWVLVSLSILPALFLTTMGLLQLVTAVSGGIVAFGLHKSGITTKLKF